MHLPVRIADCLSLELCLHFLLSEESDREDALEEEYPLDNLSINIKDLIAADALTTSELFSKNIKGSFGAKMRNLRFKAEEARA